MDQSRYQSVQPKLVFGVGCSPDAAYRIGIEARALSRVYDVRAFGAWWDEDAPETLERDGYRVRHIQLATRPSFIIRASARFVRDLFKAQGSHAARRLVPFIPLALGFGVWSMGWLLTWPFRTLAKVLRRVWDAVFRRLYALGQYLSLRLFVLAQRVVPLYLRFFFRVRRLFLFVGLKAGFLNQDARIQSDEKSLEEIVRSKLEADLRSRLTRASGRYYKQHLRFLTRENVRERRKNRRRLRGYFLVSGFLLHRPRLKAFLFSLVPRPFRQKIVARLKAPARTIEIPKQHPARPARPPEQAPEPAAARNSHPAPTPEEELIAQAAPRGSDGERVAPRPDLERTGAAQAVALASLSFESALEHKVKTLNFCRLRNFIQTNFLRASSLYMAWRETPVAPAAVHVKDFEALPFGVALKWLTGAKLVYNCYENYASQIEGITRTGAWLLRAIERPFIRHADEVITVTPYMAGFIRDQHDLARVHWIPNVDPLPRDVPADFLVRNPDSQISRLAGDRLRFIYQGGIAPARGVELLIRAWRHVDAEGAALFIRAPENQFLSSCQDMADVLGLTGRSIYFLPPIRERKETLETSMGVLRDIDVGCITYLRTVKNNVYACPRKLSHYLHAGKMILANDLNFVRHIIDEADCGLLYDARREETIAAAVNRCIADPGIVRKKSENARRYAASTYNWESFEKVLWGVYGGLGLPTPDSAAAPAETCATRHAVS